MLIAEELLLLILDDQTGKLSVDGTNVDLGLAGGVLVELVVLGKVDIAAENESVKKGRLVVRDALPTGDSVLDAGLAHVAERVGKRPQSVLGPIKKQLRNTLLERLVAAGEVRSEHGKILGIFPTLRFPAAATGHESASRARLGDVLIRGLEPDPRTGALIGLLHSIDAVTKTVPTDDRKALKRRAKAIAEGQWAPEAVRKAIQAIQSATTAAVIATMSATVTS